MKELTDTPQQTTFITQSGKYYEIQDHYELMNDWKDMGLIEQESDGYALAMAEGLVRVAYYGYIILPRLITDEQIEAIRKWLTEFIGRTGEIRIEVNGREGFQYAWRNESDIEHIVRRLRAYQTGLPLYASLDSNNVKEKVIAVRKEDDSYYEGPFWIVADSVKEIYQGKFKLIGECVPVDYIGNYLNEKLKKKGATSHKKLWKESSYSEWNGTYEYNYFPRGRVRIHNGEVYVHINSKMNTPRIINAIDNVTLQFSLHLAP